MIVHARTRLTAVSAPSRTTWRPSVTGHKRILMGIVIALLVVIICSGLGTLVIAMIAAEG